MIAAILGDIIGSVYEGYQWNSKDYELIQKLPHNHLPLIKNTEFVRKDYHWTDDSFCSLILFYCWKHNENFSETLSYYCRKYRDIGFGKNFKNWIDNPIPYGGNTNGCLMRITWIPYLNLSLEEKINLAIKCTEISHNSEESFNAVSNYINLFEDYKNNKEIICNKTIDEYHNQRKFIMDANETLNQVKAILKESTSLNDIIKNCCYVGGDVDTLASISCSISEIRYKEEISDNVIEFIRMHFEKDEFLLNIFNEFLESTNGV